MNTTRAPKFVYEIYRHSDSFSCRIFLASIRITCMVNGNFKSEDEARIWAVTQIDRLERIESR